MNVYEAHRELNSVVRRVQEVKEQITQVTDPELLGERFCMDLNMMQANLETVHQTVGQLARLLELYLDDLEDAHSCRANASSYGICTVCGSIIPDSVADHVLHGY